MRYTYTLNLQGSQGSAFYLTALAKRIIKDNDLNLDFNQVKQEMQAGDYENLLDVFFAYFGEFVKI